MRGIGAWTGLLAALLAAGCSGGGDAAPSTIPATVTTAAPTTPPTTTTTTSTTTSTSTTSSTTTTSTTLPPLPVPIAPPGDNEPEPVIEIGTIEIPRLGLSRPISEGIRMATLDRGPGHWPGTAMPGEVGNAVLAGHRVSHNRDFYDLDKLAPGDEVVMSTMSGRHVYKVVATEIVPPDALWIVDQTYDRRATLFACHPPGSVSERIVVHLELA